MSADAAQSAKNNEFKTYSIPEYNHIRVRRWTTQPSRHTASLSDTTNVRDRWTSSTRTHPAQLLSQASADVRLGGEGGHAGYTLPGGNGGGDVGREGSYISDEEQCGTGSTFWWFFFFSSRRRHTRWNCDWSSDVCSSD